MGKFFSKIWWLILVIAIAVLGIIIYFTYLQEIEIKIKKFPHTEEDTGSSSDSFPEPEKVITPPPDYITEEEEKVPQEETEKPSIPAPPPETEKIKIVAYQGIVKAVYNSSLDFEAVVPQGAGMITAQVDDRTRITQVFLGETAVRESIQLQDLQAGDKIVISGGAKDYGYPILETDNIERFYLQ